MFAKINHVAIVSNNYLAVANFYEKVFGMKLATGTRGLPAATVRDGYVGLNINPRHPGRQGGLDHFGVEVGDVEAVFEKMRARYPQVKWLRRPSNRPYAGISAHDPDGNVFDLSQADMENRSGLYTDGDSVQSRYLNHYAIRTMHPELCAAFYRDVFEFSPINRAEGDPNHYLSDGRVTLELIPWEIATYAGTGIGRTGPDHIGFKVESVAKVTDEIAELATRSAPYGPWPFASAEDRKRQEVLDGCCPLGHASFCDTDGVLFDIAE